ncbi:MAG: hypothetical protein AAF901_04225 [Bacteroidota bacterium]
MKKAICILIIFGTISLCCKEEKKEVVIKKAKVEVPHHTTWGKVAVSLEETPDQFLNQNIHLLSRTDEDSNASYIYTGKIAVDYASTYRVSILAKKTESNNLMGLRIQGEYPDRVDAVFNLETGELVEVLKGRDFENESASIEAIGDDWYRCSVMAEVTADEVLILIGPTTAENKVNGWESKTNEPCQINIIPSSITFERTAL